MRAVEVAADDTLGQGDGHDGWSGRVRAPMLYPAQFHRGLLRRGAPWSCWKNADRGEGADYSGACSASPFLEGAIERAEAVSKPILQNAFQAFIDHGYLTVRDTKLDLADGMYARRSSSVAQASALIRGRAP